jgi:hypothetical protein
MHIEKRPLGRLKSSWEEKAEIDLRKIGWDRLD